MFYTHQQKSPDVQYLEDELEREREASRRRDEEEEKSREERQRERNEQYEWEARTAETWPEALQKQIRLMSKEANWESGNNFESGRFFTDSIKGCRRALEIWKEKDKDASAEIEKLEKQVEGIKRDFRAKVASQLLSEFKNSGCRGVAQSIMDYDDPDDWLNW